jgi:hypothetical protein
VKEGEGGGGGWKIGRREEGEESKRKGNWMDAISLALEVT